MHFTLQKMMGIHTQQDDSMPTPPWTGTAALGLRKMDESHHECVDVLAKIVSASANWSSCAKWLMH
jgi:hypothetical protein